MAVVVDPRDVGVVGGGFEFSCELADHVVELIEIAGIDELLKFRQVGVLVDLENVFPEILGIFLPLSSFPAITNNELKMTREHSP